MSVPLRKWYFAINEAGVRDYERMILAAVKSCRLHTDLAPHCLYHGGDVPLLPTLEAMGVRILRRDGSLLPAIRATADNGNWAKVIATGAYLRLDIPLVETADEFVLYTDADVMFERGLGTRWMRRPRFFSAAPEVRLYDWSFFNSGAMVINVPAMRAVHDDFIAFAQPRLSEFYKAGHGTYDQGALNAYFAGRWDRLPLDWNWKPYWGKRRRAAIVHFHGPKPRHLEAILAGRLDGIPQIYRTIYAMNPAGCRYYLERFQALEAS